MTCANLQAVAGLLGQRRPAAQSYTHPDPASKYHRRRFQPGRHQSRTRSADVQRVLRLHPKSHRRRVPYNVWIVEGRTVDQISVRMSAGSLEVWHSTVR